VDHHNGAFVGIDTSKLRNAVAVAEEGRGGDVRYFNHRAIRHGDILVHAYAGLPVHMVRLAMIARMRLATRSASMMLSIAALRFAA
jgi:hypothetical protein